MPVTPPPLLPFTIEKGKGKGKYSNTMVWVSAYVPDALHLLQYANKLFVSGMCTKQNFC